MDNSDQKHKQTDLTAAAPLPVTMDQQAAVVFRNVGQLYFPQTRVECHYSLTPEHQWSSHDWIGIFPVDWSSLKQYHTYTWVLVPEGYTEPNNVNCCVLFYSSYLPRPSPEEYQFVYVDKLGEVCARSRPFTFCAPKPLDELETLKEDKDAEDGEEELLLVVSKAQLLQSQLEESLKTQADLQQALETVKKEAETEKEKSDKAKMEWEIEREALKEEIAEITQNLDHNCEMMKRMEGKHKDVKYSQVNLTSELSKLLSEKDENQQRIKDLEDAVKILTDRAKEENGEVERLKERLKKMSNQMTHDEEKRKALQVENEAAVSEVRGLQERLEASEHVTESLRRELRDLGGHQTHVHAELHQARLHVAQLTLQLSEENLLLREERAALALEREANKHAAETDKKKLQDLSCEVQRKQEWLQEERMEREKIEVELGRDRDCNRVLLSEANREAQEMRAIVRKVQKEQEEQQLEKEDLLSYIHQLEQKLGVEVPSSLCPGSPSKQEEPAFPTSFRSVTSPLFGSTHLELPSRGEIAAEIRFIQSKEDTPAVDTQEEKRPHFDPQAAEMKPMILPKLTDPMLSELADSTMW
ncbi:calcium-binding and coiled-coil domain-containing protein 1-like isoform X1 [Genypterus blacodes]|uniref:calcium-binding and coiled-coil domain-containing protein 1-like isoform X1 n=1 Tax=Genypterus blacodes TaxID=154954 RepID=UPI003F769586